MKKERKREREMAYLEQIQEIDAEIVNKQADADMWWQRATSLGNQQTGERVQTSRANTSMRPADIAMDIERDIAALYAERKEIIRTIKSLPAPYSDILYKRYVLGMMFKEIAAGRRKDESWATTAHGRALNMVKIILDKMEG